LLFVVGAIALNYWIRSKYLNVYARLKEPPLVKENAQELHPDVNTHDSTPAFNNYLDEFLQAVRVFGFLEKPVRLHLMGVTASSNARCCRSSTNLPVISRQEGWLPEIVYL
jgi:hypothetical protein